MRAARAFEAAAEAPSLTVAELRHEATIAVKVDPSLAITLLNAALRRRPGDPQVLWDKARIEYGSHKLAEAEATLTKLLETDPERPEAIQLLIKVLQRQARSAEASRWYRRLHTGDGEGPPQAR